MSLSLSLSLSQNTRKPRNLIKAYLLPPILSVPHSSIDQIIKLSLRKAKIHLRHLPLLTRFWPLVEMLRIQLRSRRVIVGLLQVYREILDRKILVHLDRFDGRPARVLPALSDDRVWQRGGFHLLTTCVTPTQVPKCVVRMIVDWSLCE